MAMSADEKGSEGYDRSDPDSIKRYAAKLTGKTLSEILGSESGVSGGVNTKGYFGQLVESQYFMLDNNSTPAPDFKEAGIELKVTPMKKVLGQLASKERLVLGIIDYNMVPEKHFRIFLDKNSHILIVFYLWTPDTDVYDYRILKVVDWIPTDEELRMIKEDWDVIEGYVLRGQAHLLSERHTKYLAACTKGAGHGGDMRTQPMSDILAKQRALSLKHTYMTSLYYSHEDVNETLERPRPDASDSVFSWEWPPEETFETHVTNHFKRFIGKTCQEIEDMLGIDLDPSPKQYYSMLTLAMLGMRGKKHVKEFVQAGITLKTMRIRHNGTPKEYIPFPAFKYEEVAEAEWETSEFYQQLDHQFFFSVFQFDTTDDDCPKKQLRFKGTFFWYVPDEDFEIIAGVWKDTKEKILREDFDHFIKASDKRISHIRPHAQNNNDTYPFRGKNYTKKCFWFNGQYMKSVIEKGLKGQSTLEERDDSPKD